MASTINSTDTGAGGLITTGDSSDELQLQTAEVARVTLTNTAVVVNESGADVDFRVEGDTNANLLFVDASTDRVGIGTSTPAVPLDIDIGTDNNAIYCRSSDQFCNIALTDDVGSVKLGSDNGSLFFETGGTTSFTSIIERARFTSDGYLRMASGSGGIQFGGDTAAANALDDYEEGTWTPTFTGSGTNPTVTYTVQQGQYTKIGRTVHVQCNMLPATYAGGSGSLRIGGLPFTSAGGTFYSVGAAYLDNVDLGANQTWATSYIPPNLDYIRILTSGDNVAANEIAVTGVAVGDNFLLQVTYFV